MPSSSSITALGLVLAAAATLRTVEATIAVSYPVASTSCTGGQPCGPFTWQIDDSVLPPGADFGVTSVGIYTGSVNQQTLFMDLGTVSDPTRMLEIPATAVPANLGPNGDFYFLRFQSESAVDPATGFPLQAFSAKFTLTGMTGQLAPEVSAQILGSSIASRTTAAAATTTARNNRVSSDLAPGSTSVSAGRNNLAATGAAGRNGTSIAADTGAASSSMKIASRTAGLGFLAVAGMLAL